MTSFGSFKETREINGHLAVVALILVRVRCLPTELSNSRDITGTDESVIDLSAYGLESTPCLPTMNPRSRIALVANINFLRLAYSFCLRISVKIC